MKKLILAAFLSFVWIGCFAQEYTMTVQKTDGTELSYTYDNGVEITFSGQTLTISTTGSASEDVSINFSDIAKIYFKSAASVVEGKSNDLLFIYPNPAKDSFKIAGAENETYSLYSMDGRLVLQGVNNGEEINVSSLAKGVYAVKINGQTFKFAKQ